MDLRLRQADAPEVTASSVGGGLLLACCFGALLVPT